LLALSDVRTATIVRFGSSTESASN
jgi:hypothetical protein